MIGFIKGKVHSYGLDYVLIENNGIGYHVFFAHPDSIVLNQDVMIYTYQHVKEDEISLFGFISNEEKNLFMNLISVKGVGPKTALNILAATKVEHLISAIENSDLSILKKLPGIGAKTASQIILDLKGKLIQDVAKEGKKNINYEDAISGLKSLGYKASELQFISKELSSKENLSTDELIKEGLKLLLKRKIG